MLCFIVGDGGCDSSVIGSFYDQSPFNSYVPIPTKVVTFYSDVVFPGLRLL